MKFRNGQVALYLLMVIVAIALLSFLNIDTFISVRGKNRVQNAGDAAALAAATKQAILLNNIGQLNIEHIKAAIENDRGKCDDIVLRQHRIALLEPLDALRCANDAAKINGMEVNPAFAKILHEHANIVRAVYAGGENESGEPFPEPWPGAWMEYAQAIDNVAGEGLATGPDNCEFLTPSKGHPLLTPEFYYAIAGRDWCWFHFNNMGLLTDYDTYKGWAPLPMREDDPFTNSEIFSLHLDGRKCALADVFPEEELLEFLEKRVGVDMETYDHSKTNLLYDSEQTWFFYGNRWGTWFNGRSLADDEFGWNFPIVGEIKPEYNVFGAACVCRCYETVPSISLDSDSTLTWSAAAKPFGTVETENGVDRVTALYSFVVPSFEDSRLVAIDAVSSGSLGSADVNWVFHVREHLPDYMVNGPSSRGCFFCVQLKTWEKKSFRRSGISWLKYNSHTCVRPVGGSGGSGGTSHGH